jgi:ubiquinone/menaquinone biosynthesis C-methylase UbiE
MLPMDAPPGSHQQPTAQAEEVARIRAVYERMERGGPRSEVIRRASGMLAAERMTATRQLLGQLLPMAHPRLLDVGCGGGGDLHALEVAGWTPDLLAGVDLTEVRLATARDLCPGVDLRLSDGPTIPFPDATFDVATASTVFSSIRDAELQRALFAEMERVVRPGGVMLVYDFVIRKPTNPNVVSMPLQRLSDLGRKPQGSIRLSPLLHAVAAALLVSPRLGSWAMNFAPRTHRLTYWRKAADLRARQERAS